MVEARNPELSIEKDPTYLEAVRSVASYLALTDTEMPSHVGAIFVVGGAGYSGGVHPQTEKATELYAAAKAPKIVIACSAGTNAGNLKGRKEHEVYRDELIQLGVPSGAIFAREGGNNTKTEAVSGISLMEELGIDLSQGVILTSTAPHARRARRTWEKVLELLGKQATLYSQPGVEPLNPENFDQVARLYGEVLRLIVYGKQGNLIEEPIPKDVKSATAKIRAGLLSIGVRDNKVDQVPKPYDFAKFLQKKIT